MDNLRKAFREYFSYSCTYSEFWSSVLKDIDSFMRPLKNQIEHLRLCKRAVLDEEFLIQFPGIKERLLGKILVGLENEMRSVFNIQENMKMHLEAIKSHLNTVEKEYSKFDPEEPRDFDCLIPSCEHLIEHALDVWRCYHILWIGIKTSIEMVDYNEAKSVEAVEKSFLRYNKIKPHLEYISSLTQYLRTQTSLIDQT